MSGCSKRPSANFKVEWPARLAHYLAGRLPAADSVEIVRAGAMPAGASNETIALDVRVTCDGFAADLALVLRPERPDGILAPYDVERQYRIMRALAPTPVPVPAVAWYEQDTRVLGAPFFLMERVVAQTPPLFWYGPGPRVDAAARALATIHAIGWREAGLGFLRESAATHSPLANEIGPWRIRAERSRMDRAPVLAQLERYLVANEPTDATLALLHGDTNAGNYLFRGDDVVAVVDWELSTLGDPRSDLGFYAALEAMFGGYREAGNASVLAEAYERVTGAPLTNMGYYEAWGLYRMMVVMGGWAGRGWGGFYGMEAIAHRLNEVLGRGWSDE